MHTTLDCVPCLVRQAAGAARLCFSEESRQTELMRDILPILMDEPDWARSPTVVAQRLHRYIRKETGNLDPYLAYKERMNRLALELLPCLLREVRTEEFPQTSFVRLALAGNLIGGDPSAGMSEMEIRTALCRACRGECRVDSAQTLFRAAEQARNILFLTDNAGEIVLDRALLEALPLARIVVGVRGSPVINDATIADAEMAGLPNIVSVIPNGSDAPGTILADCSGEFRRVFETADLIIAKGQGNYESLEGTSKHIFFLQHITCPCVAAQCGVPVGSLAICERNGTNAPKKNVIIQ